MHVAIADTCITSYESCDHELIAAFDALHLLVIFAVALHSSLPRSQPFLLWILWKCVLSDHTFASQ